MSLPRRLLAELRGAYAVLRFDPEQIEPADPRSERIAALGLGVLLLGGAVGTYLALSAGFGPRPQPAPDPPPTAVVHTPSPVPAPARPPGPAIAPAAQLSPPASAGAGGPTATGRDAQSPGALRSAAGRPRR